MRITCYIIIRYKCYCTCLSLVTTGSESSTPPFTRKSPLEVLFVNVLAPDISITLPLLLVSVPPFTESASVLLVSFNTESAVVHTADNFSAAFTVMLNNPVQLALLKEPLQQPSILLLPFVSLPVF